VVEVITEVVSGIAQKRKGLVLLQQTVEQQQIDKVVVDELSRLGRSTLEVLKVIEYLNERKVSLFIRSYNMETLREDKKRNPMAQPLLTFLAEFARMEREQLSERVRSGLEEARRKGKILGRPAGITTPPEKILAKHKKVVALLGKQNTIRDVAKMASVSTATVQKVKALLSAKK
jgi:DNA invertase Pin-like site-specific DNA recombinase